MTATADELLVRGRPAGVSAVQLARPYHPEVRLLILAGLCIGCGHRASTQLDTLVRTPTTEPVPGCRADGDAMRLDAAAGADVPLVVMEELHMHGDPPPSPTIAVWADGSVVFANERRLLESNIGATRAKAFARNVFVMLRDVPRYTMRYNTSNSQLTTITVRAGNRWRSATVDAVWRDDFVAAARGVQTERSSEIAELAIDPLPLAFAKAYLQLLEGRPRSGREFQPYDYDLIFYAPPEPRAPSPPELAWPSDLPRPPIDLEPHQCPLESEGCSFFLDARYRDAAARTDRQLTRTGQLVALDTRRFAVELMAQASARSAPSPHARESCPDDDR